ncbi:DNA-binding transcriptional regulator, PadR family [Evansella caseinilytica]|uniref:DNA-binding transcriptional regulator, PadR family n=1 Tax=Evansella caseinilytica TaxID=1503961 RepID=A0A1H3PY20_9BACI|nr:PadR family transcriptional regulator [Evansella caseinilytica]SDZ05853.1 DNA-binding transcriptional regulator, PadR family [Evansella caseinilytica]
MTRMMVLGLLLTHGPMSGYEIQQMMQSAKTDMWAYVKPASIYHALKKLRFEGKVVLETVEQTGLRTKSIFKITTDGENELRKLLIDSFSKSSLVFPTTLYTALTFMDNLSNEEVLEALEKQETEIIGIYESMKNGYREKERYIGEMPGNIEAIFQNIYAQCELQLKCITEIKNMIKES